METKSFDKVAIVGNVVNSKGIEDRNNFQIQLKILLESLNDRFESDLAGKFRITLGDEFQALLHNPAHLMVILDEISLSLAPIKVRFGIGLGELNTTSSILNDEELDGPAYWHAREALNRVSKNNLYGRALTYCLGGKSEDLSLNVLNSIFELQDTLRLSWTDDQANIIEYLIKEYAYGTFVQKDVSKLLTLSQQRISNVLAATSYKQYANSRNVCTELIRSLTHCIYL